MLIARDLEARMKGGGAGRQSRDSSRDKRTILSDTVKVDMWYCGTVEPYDFCETGKAAPASNSSLSWVAPRFLLPVSEALSGVKGSHSFLLLLCHLSSSPSPQLASVPKVPTTNDDFGRKRIGSETPFVSGSNKLVNINLPDGFCRGPDNEIHTSARPPVRPGAAQAWGSTSSAVEVARFSGSLGKVFLVPKAFWTLSFVCILECQLEY